jgi:hypothetical protein
MRNTIQFCLVVGLFVVCVQPPVHAQSTQGGSPVTAVPRLIWFTGAFRPADGSAPAPVELATLSIYRESVDGTAIWQETQSVPLNADGRFNVLVGSSTADGLPLDLFTSGQPRWLGIQFHRTGEPELPRVQLLSVPYAMKAIDADTLGGRPASAYMLAPTSAAAGSSTTGSSLGGAAPGSAGPSTSPGSGQSATGNAILAGAPNFLAKYVNSVDVGPAQLYDTGAAVGLGTTVPFDMFHVRFTNTAGTATGFAVQNLGNTAASYSGMLFYDQNNATALFQGFNNVTHEYRINNVASGASINFLIGSSSKFTIASNGNVGIGTPAPVSTLQVAGDVYGTTTVVSVAGVHGENTAASGTPATGVLGDTNSNSNGTGASGGVTGVLGRVVPTSPGGYSAGVRGVNSGTGGNGIGVVGYQGGSGWGVYGETPSGLAVYGLTTNSTASSTGVRGETFSANGTGVVARFSGAGVGNALEVGNGAIKVSGSNRAAFQHVATLASITSNFTTIDNPMTNGDPNAILLVTPVLLPPDDVYTNFPIGVWYSSGASKWTIFNQNSGGGFPQNAAFNVLVIKQ